MKVSLRRKSHIMALPQWTLRKACRSADQSVTMPCPPSSGEESSAVSLINSCCAICDNPSWPFLGGESYVNISSVHVVQSLVHPGVVVVGQHQGEQPQPDHQQEVPVKCAKLQAEAQRGEWDAVVQFGAGSGQCHHSAGNVQGVQRCQQVEEGVGRVGRQEIAEAAHLPPCHELAGEEAHGEECGGGETSAGLGEVVPARCRP